MLIILNYHLYTVHRIKLDDLQEIQPNDLQPNELHELGINDMHEMQPNSPNIACVFVLIALSVVSTHSAALEWLQLHYIQLCRGKI